MAGSAWRCGQQSFSAWRTLRKFGSRSCLSCFYSAATLFGTVSWARSLAYVSVGCPVRGAPIHRCSNSSHHSNDYLQRYQLTRDNFHATFRRVSSNTALPKRSLFKSPPLPFINLQHPFPATPFLSHSYEKHRGWGGPRRDSCPPGGPAAQTSGETL